MSTKPLLLLSLRSKIEFSSLEPELACGCSGQPECGGMMPADPGGGMMPTGSSCRVWAMMPAYSGHRVWWNDANQLCHLLETRHHKKSHPTLLEGEHGGSEWTRREARALQSSCQPFLHSEDSLRHQLSASKRLHSGSRREKTYQPNCIYKVSCDGCFKPPDLGPIC
jgi:hypothetical protein